MEHYRCANIDAHIKLTYQNGSQQYLCTECLTKDPKLAVQHFTFKPQIQHVQTNPVHEPVEILVDDPAVIRTDIQVDVPVEAPVVPPG